MYFQAKPAASKKPDGRKGIRVAVFRCFFAKSIYTMAPINPLTDDPLSGPGCKAGTGKRERESDMKDETLEINGFECRIISNPGRGACIVLLHGYMYTSDVWNDIGLLRLLEQKGIPFKAIDMPYGHANETVPRNPDPAENAGIVARVAPPEAVLVGASLGGYIALRHCVTKPAAGLMLIAPVMSLQGELASHYARLSLPVSIIYGQADNVVLFQEIQRLARLLDTGVRIYEKARHAAYLDQPERFKKDVLDFYGAVTRSAAP